MDIPEEKPEYLRDASQLLGIWSIAMFFLLAFPLLTLVIHPAGFLFGPATAITSFISLMIADGKGTKFTGNQLLALAAILFIIASTALVIIAHKDGRFSQWHPMQSVLELKQ